MSVDPRTTLAQDPMRRAAKTYSVAALTAMGRYGEVWGAAMAYSVAALTSMSEIWGDMGRYGEMWGDMGRSPP